MRLPRPAPGARSVPVRARRITPVVLLLLALTTSPVAAESDIVLPLAGTESDLDATTFDIDGEAIGQSSFRLRPLESGHHRMEVEMAGSDGSANRSQALFATVANVAQAASRGGSQTAAFGLRLLEQRAQATRADGTKLDLLIVDHVEGRASCYPPDDTELERGRHVELPGNDRVVNVPMQLLFQPLVAGEVDDIRFQIVLCRDEPHVQDMLAVRGPRHQRDDREVIEIRYGPDFGRTVAWLASRLLPTFSFWFDADTGAYLGHRMPLHRKGPEILLVREGLVPLDLGIE